MTLYKIILILIFTHVNECFAFLMKSNINLVLFSFNSIHLIRRKLFGELFSLIYCSVPVHHSMCAVPIFCRMQNFWIYSICCILSCNFSTVSGSFLSYLRTHVAKTCMNSTLFLNEEHEIFIALC